MPTGDFPFGGEFPVTQTTGGACPICGGAYINAVGHGWGVCKAQESRTVRYVGVTPDQMRQIVREELKAALAKFGIPQGAPQK